MRRDMVGWWLRWLVSRSVHIGRDGLERKETPEKISSSMSFDIQNKLEIIQRWRREDELWDSSHGFFFFFVQGEKKKEREREREREGEREGEREMKKMAKAPLSCKFKCGRDVPANLNVRSLDGQRHTKHGQGKPGRGEEGRRRQHQWTLIRGWT